MRNTHSDTEKMNSKPWYALDVDEVRTLLDVPDGGLSEQEAKQRLERYGPNKLPAPQRRSSFARFLVQFHNLLIYALLGAALVTGVLGHWLDFGVILGVVIINALIGFIQEGKAEKALDSIRGMLSLRAYTERDAHRREIAAEELVPGDLVLLQAGDKVPADMRLLRTKDLRVDEALLTGESQAVVKQTDAVNEDAVLGDRLCMAYSGTVVTYGRATGVVAATGEKTEIGRISEMLTSVETISTPLLRKMDVLARWLTLAVIVLGGAAFTFGVLIRDYTAVDMFLASVGLIVAAIPEGLPAIIAITLAIGVQRMARRKSIIRRLPAVETLGAITVICSDKTGTLTRNEMMVRDLVCADATFEVEGAGYNPHGALLHHGEAVKAKNFPLLSTLGQVSLLCNDSTLGKDDNEQWTIHGDPTEGALLSLGPKLGLNAKHENANLPRADAIPFESEHRFMATLNHDHTGNAFIFLKGAPERVLELCKQQARGNDNVDLESVFWHEAAEKLAANGRRVLALAWKKVDPEQHNLTFEDIHTFTLLGLVGITDPPRVEAIEAVKRCKTAGIKVKMITGDHARTALAIARDMGIGDGERVLTGADIEDADDAQLEAWVRDVDVFARTSPEHKLRIVGALQKCGEISAMTGDGVNDAPALKRADVGVAMGLKGTEVSKEASEMVLTDDNFASIVDAVEEGRTVYDNIRKAITFILPTNGGEAFVIIAAIALGRVMPITPVQILWINMITAVSLALSLAFEPPEKDIMTRPPRPPGEPLVSVFLGWRIFCVSLILLTGTFGLYLYEREMGANIDTARTIAVNTLVMFEAFYLFNCRYLHRNVISREGLLGNRMALYAVGVVVVFQLLFTYAPPLQALFATAPLDVTDWIKVVLTGSTVFILVEMEKAIMHRYHRRVRKFNSK